MQGPDGLVDVDDVSEGVREGRSFGDGRRHRRLEEIHGGEALRSHKCAGKGLPIDQEGKGQRMAKWRQRRKGMWTRLATILRVWKCHMRQTLPNRPGFRYQSIMSALIIDVMRCQAKPRKVALRAVRRGRMLDEGMVPPGNSGKEHG